MDMRFIDWRAYLKDAQAQADEIGSSCRVNLEDVECDCRSRRVLPDSEFTFVRLETVNGRIQIRKQCNRCELLTDGGAQKQADHPNYQSYPLITVAQKQAIYDAYYKRRSEKYEARRRMIQARVDSKNQVWWSRYNEYLESYEWSVRREAVLERCGGICEGCRKRKVQHIHHLTYSHAGNELLYQLVGLCSKCHELAHEK